MMIRLAIFDLDGTLLDTVADLAASTNHALKQCGFPEHDVSAYYRFVGNGINKLFERALPEGEKTESNILKIRSLFLPYYDAHKTDCTQPYPGIPELLEELHGRGVKLAVASNKYQAATGLLVEKFFPSIPFSVVLGQREGIPVKPDPAIVNEILHRTGLQAAEAIYIGDSGMDMQTANNASVKAIGVTWGFRPENELAANNPAYIVDEAKKIATIISEKLF